MELTYYGHSCFLITTNGTRVLFDPFISPNPEAKDIDLKTIQPDYILLSHGHEDHVADTVELAAQKDATVVGQPEVAGWFTGKGVKNTHQMNIGGNKKFDFGTVKMVNAIHSSSMPDGTYGGNPAGYVVQAEGKTIYFAGDTALTYDMKIIGEQFAVDYALLPVGDNFTMGPEDALTAAAWVKAKKTIAMHYNTFPPITIDRKTVSGMAQKVNKELIFMEIGQTISI
ncbi:MAG TPA: metal-dependent hydrolase [Adhaeribacter sp.]|nr:metal-dependent hydrolase [Adhaeribacter sp.]